METSSIKVNVRATSSALLGQPREGGRLNSQDVWVDVA